MDGELVLMIVGLLVWFVFSLIGKLAKSSQSPYVPPPPPPREQQGQYEGELPPLPEQQQAWSWQQDAAQQQRAQQQQAQRQPSPFGRALREIMKEAGLELPPLPSEQPVPSEHTTTWGEHQRTWSESVPTTSETMLSSSEQRRTISETRLTASEQRLVRGEHELSRGEHTPGDAWAASEQSPWDDQAIGPGCNLGNRIVGELRRGPGPLVRAIVLQEILNPPVGLRPPGSGRR